MRKIAACMLAICLSGPAIADQDAPWPPSPDHPLWTGAPPHAFPVTAPENTASDPKELIAGRPLISVNDVSRPTLTLYRPKSRNTGAAVVVYPGGGHAFGLRHKDKPITDWPDLALPWMRTIGVIAP